MPEVVRPVACVKEIKSFRMHIMEKIFEIKSCIEILVNNIKIYSK